MEGQKTTNTLFRYHLANSDYYNDNKLLSSQSIKIITTMEITALLQF